jgi:hypothetical protein
MVYAVDSKPAAARLEGSTPSPGTSFSLERFYTFLMPHFLLLLMEVSGGIRHGRVLHYQTYGYQAY